METLRPRFALVVLAFGLALPAGCGYSVVRYQGAIPGAETLAIQPLSNESYEPGVEAVVLEALRREALQRGGLRLIEDPEAADVVLSGAVSGVVVTPRSFSSVVLAVEYEVYLGLSLQAARRDADPIALDGRALNARDFFTSSADLEATRKNKRETIHRLAQVVADRVYDALYETARP